jgi:phosphomannomutase
VYWQDGGQLVPPQDAEIIKVIEALRYDEIQFKANNNLIEYIDTEVDNAFQNQRLITRVSTRLRQPNKI